jgi:hypothetical protein
MRIETNNSWRVRVPAGTYVLGDPCYAVPDNLWNEAGQSCDWWQSNPVATVTVEGKEYKILGFGTAHGDGIYNCRDGIEYPVDAGMIGLVPIELANPQDPDFPLNSLVVFDRETLCTNDDGVMQFGNIHIDTKNQEEEEEY